MSEERASYRLTGIIIVALALFLIAFDLAFFIVCDSGLAVCFSWSTNRVSDLTLVLFLGLFFVGIGVLAWPVDREEAQPAAADDPTSAPEGVRSAPATRPRRRASSDAVREPPS